MKNIDFRELKEIGAPLQNYLRDNFNPHTYLVIDSNGIRVVEDIAFTPLKDIANPEELAIR